MRLSVSPLAAVSVSWWSLASPPGQLLSGPVTTLYASFVLDPKYVAMPVPLKVAEVGLVRIAVPE